MAIVGAAMQIAFWTLVLPAVLTLLPKLLGNFFYAIGALFFKLLDMLQNVFRKLAGLGTVYADGEEVNDIVTYVLKSDVIVDVLVSVAVFALGLVILGSIVQMIRLEYTTEGSKNSKEQVFSKALKSLLMFVLIPIVCLVGIRLSNYLLQAIDYATAPNGASTVSGSIFSASGSEASKIADKDNIQSVIDITDLFGTIGKDKDYANAIADPDSVNGKMIVKNFGENFASVSCTDDSKSQESARQKLAKKVAEKFTMASNDDEGTIKVGKKLSEITGLPATAYDNTKLSKNTTLSYLSIDAVSYFYNTGNFNYIMMYLSCFLCLKALFTASMGMIARIYKLTAYFIISPAVIGLQPLDNGSAYGKWRGEFISNVLSCYGFIVALNLYFSIVTVLQTIELWQGAWAFGLNYFVQLLFVVTGATMINDLAGKLGSFIGGGNVMADGESATKAVGAEMGKIGKLGVAGMNMVGGVAGGIANKIKGKQIKRAEKFNAEDKEFNEKYKLNNKNEFLDKDGNKLEGKELKHAQKLYKDTRPTISGDGDKVKKNKYVKAHEKLNTEEKMNEARAKLIGSKARNGMRLNRVKEAVGGAIVGSGIVGAFKNITGNIGGYVSGKAFESADKAYGKRLKDETGIDMEDYGVEAGGNNGLKTAGKVLDKAGKKIRSRGNNYMKDLAGEVNDYNQRQANREVVDDIVNEKNANYDAVEKEITGKQVSIRKETEEMRHEHNGINTTMLPGAVSGYKEYSQEDLSGFNKFMQDVQGFKNGNMTADDFGKNMYGAKSNYGFQGLDGNKYVEGILDSIEKAFSDAGKAKGDPRAWVGALKGLDVSAGELNANIHDSANDTKTYGTYKERQKYEDLSKTYGDLEAAKEVNNEARRDLNVAHQKIKSDTTGAYGVEQFVKDTNPGDEKANEANKKLAKDIADALKNTTLKTALGGESGKMKVDFAPVSKILNDIKQKQEQEAQKAKDAEASQTKTNELLSKLLENAKNKK